MSDAAQKQVVDAVAAAAASLNIYDTGASPQVLLPFVARDKPVVEKEDVLPFCLVTCSRDPQDPQEHKYLDAQRGTVVYPVQLTLVGPSNRSHSEGLGMLQLVKEQLREAFAKQQPRLLEDRLPLLWKQEVRSPAPMDDKPWRSMYVVLVLFVMVTLALEL